MLISVVVPVYKVEKYLSRCIDSILNQTFNDFDLILVDDGSPDSCGDICEKYAKTDNRITVIHRKNGGLSAARNSGIEWALKYSDSEWITFVDSDDWLHPDYLKILLECAKKFNTEISVCNFLRTADNAVNSTLNKKLNVQKYSCEDFFINYNLNAVVAWGKLYKKKLFKDIRYPEGKVHEDELTTYKLLFLIKNIVFIHDTLYYYFINKKSITQGKNEDVWDTNKLYFIMAMEERLKYFKKYKFNSALQFQKEEYLYFMYIYCKFLHKNMNMADTQRYMSYIRGKLRTAIFINIGKMKTFYQKYGENYRDMYGLAYPMLSGIYWRTIGKLKLKNKNFD